MNIRTWLAFGLAIVGLVVVGIAGCGSSGQVGGYRIATGSDPGFGPYLDLLQWGPSSDGLVRGTLAT